MPPGALESCGNAAYAASRTPPRYTKYSLNCPREPKPARRCAAHAPLVSASATTVLSLPPMLMTSP